LNVDKTLITETNPLLSMKDHMSEPNRQHQQKPSYTNHCKTPSRSLHYQHILDTDENIKESIDISIVDKNTKILECTQRNVSPSNGYLTK
jgi:hypothetical protein